jgi:predicted dehydrogenase
MSTGGSPRRIRVGIIGASANPGAWASAAHVPALKALPEYELVAVASRNQENADAAAAAHGIPHAYGDYLEMVQRPDLDMICVSTSSAHHHSLVMPAIAAGKHVFCEWPFGTCMKETLEMRDAARERGVRTLVGLQTRYAPIVSYVRDLIADGFVGTLWSINLYRANDQTAQKAVTPEYLEFLERANAGLRILVGHGLDTLAAYVGELVDLQAYMEVEMNKIRLVTGEIAPVTHKDHILVQGRLAGGAVASILMKQNSPTYKPFHLEISGSNGAIIVTTGPDLKVAARHPGVPFDFTMMGTSALGQPFEPMEVPARYRLVPDATPAGQPIDVAHMYRHFAEALANNLPCDTDFDHGVHRHRLLETIVKAADTGQRQRFDAAA